MADTADSKSAEGNFIRVQVSKGPRKEMRMSSKRDWALAITVVRDYSDRAEHALKDRNHPEIAYSALLQATRMTSAFVKVFRTNKKFDEKAFRDACRITV